MVSSEFLKKQIQQNNKRNQRFAHATRAAKNIVNSVRKNIGSVAKGEPLLEGSAVAQKRLNICNSCEKYNNGICSECLCFLKAKTYLKAEKCPLNKW